jgi:hypothetical protein
MMCLGSAQELKNKYGKDFRIVIRVHGSEDNIQPIVDIITEHIPSTFVKDQHLKQVELGVPSSSGVHLWELFALLEQENIRRNIQNYTVTQASLDQVFHNFARLQNNDYDTEHKYFENLAYTPEDATTIRSSMYSTMPGKQSESTSRTLKSVPYEIETLEDRPDTVQNVYHDSEDILNSESPSTGRKVPSESSSRRVPVVIPIGAADEIQHEGEGDVRSQRPTSMSERVVTADDAPQRQSVVIHFGEED